MKRYGITRICMTVCLVFGIIFLPANQLKAQAAEIIATVHGTILSGTTSDLLLLSTKQGKMEIKLDSSTDTSDCKILLPDREISVAVTSGNDGYLHAAAITSQAQTSSETLDSSTATVTGTLSDKSKDNILYVKTPQGDMELKLDTTTDMSGCSVLVIGKTYRITCARGSDAYMHAVSISDSASASSSSSTPQNGNTAYLSVTGEVDDRTREDLLYLSTNEGVMQFRIDYNADTGKGMVLTPNNKLTVYFYNGSDGYLHAVTIAGDKSSSKANVDTSSTVTVSGTVRSKSNQNMLYLETAQGDMELKLDAVNSMNNCKVLVSGKRISVDCAYGSDSYMHAINITGIS